MHLDLEFVSVPSIVAICFFVGIIVRISDLDNKWIPAISGMSGAIFGIIAWLFVPGLLETDVLSAIAIGMASGFAATGINEVKGIFQKIVPIPELAQNVLFPETFTSEAPTSGASTPYVITSEDMSPNDMSPMDLSPGDSPPDDLSPKNLNTPFPEMRPQSQKKGSSFDMQQGGMQQGGMQQGGMQQAGMQQAGMQQGGMKRGIQQTGIPQPRLPGRGLSNQYQPGETGTPGSGNRQSGRQLSGRPGYAGEVSDFVREAYYDATMGMNSGADISNQDLNGRTVSLAYGEARQYPFLIRSRTDEKIIINKPEFVIGRIEGRVDYFMTDNSAISRIHAVIISRDGKYYIVDTESINATCVNGVRIPVKMEVEISHGSIIKLANEDFVFLRN